MVNISGQVLEREKEVSEFIERHAATFDLDPNLVRAIITQESRFVAEATSPTGAYGYGQFTSIGAKQVRNISAMLGVAADLANFQKADADKPDLGIKAICATLWWLFNRKYHAVSDKKVQLEAALTFYNAGGRPAALIVKHGGHAAALPFIKAMPNNFKSQSEKYAPQTAAWYVRWHEIKKKAVVTETHDPVPTVNPFDDKERSLDPKYRALVEALNLMARNDGSVDFIVNTREGMTEVTLIFQGEL